MAAGASLAVRLEAAAVLALLLAPLALAQAPSTAWTQTGGDAGKTRVVDELPPTLDVLASFLIHPDDEWVRGPLKLVDTGEHVLGLASGVNATDTGTCTWLRLADVRHGAVERVAPFPCAQGQLLGFDPVRAIVLTCLFGGPEVVVAAFDASSLQERWRVPPPPGSEDAGVSSAGYVCVDAAIDPDAGTAAVAWHSPTGRGALHLLEVADGSTVWVSELRSSARVAPQGPRLLDPAISVLPSDRVEPWAVTKTTTGYVVYGSSNAVLIAEVATWINANGSIRGAESALTPREGEIETGSEDTTPPATAAAASGPHAAWLFGDHIFVVDPSLPDPSRYRIAIDDANNPAARPIWRGPSFILPDSRGLRGLESAGFTEEWRWAGIPASTLRDAFATAVGDVYALTVSFAFEGARMHVARLDGSTGAELQRIPLPREESVQGGGQLVPVPRLGIVLVVRQSGPLTVLGSAPMEERPRIEVSDEHPSAEDTVALSVVSPEGASPAETIVAWGDGEVDTYTGTPRHRYAKGEPATVRVTLVRADNTTVTGERTVFVNVPRPQELTALQRAFSPENQELTFFLLGIALTGGGALFAVLLRRQRHARLAEEEARLRAVIDASLLTPTSGLVALEAHRAHLKDAHTRRRLDDAQFHLLDQRAVRAMKSARYRLLGASLNKLSPHFRRVLDTALEDGNVTSGEMAALVGALDEERGLADAEREKVRALLAGWAR